MSKNRLLLIFLLLTVILLSACSSSADGQNAVDSGIQNAVSTGEQNTAPEADLSETPTHEPITTNEDIPVQPSVTGNLEIDFLDVGQADCIYIILPNGETMLIDAGDTPTSEKVVQSIKDNNTKGVIDYVVATHPHSDHIGGMAAVINAFTIKNVWMTDATTNTKVFENLLDTLKAKNLLFKTAKVGKILFDYGKLKAVFIAPNGSGYKDLNEYSAAILLTYNDNRFLFMGDAGEESEAEILASGIDISADVLKVGHHGSSTASTKAFIKKVSPKFAVISCGKGNSYGHPASQTLATLSEFGIDVKRTDEDGTIVFYSDGEKITFSTFQTEIQPRAPTTTPSETTEPKITEQPSAKAQDQNTIVYITNTGTKYHRDGCRYLSKSKIPISLEEARKNYEPCSVCKPPQ